MYKFNEEQHIHTLDDIPLHGVTTVLKVISKPALIQWAATVSADLFRDEVQKWLDSDLPINRKLQENLSWIYEQAKTAHRKKKEKAGDWGTTIHTAIEEWIKLKIESKLEGEQKIVFDKFKEWVKANKIEFLESEKHVYSRELWIGGILDLVFTMDGKKYIGDIKTASGIYQEAFFQMGAYDLCLEAMNEHRDIEGYIVINLKKDGTIDFKRADNMQVNRDAFLAALTLHKIINSLE
jgi:CRISPR/Cas system-associated exonuclease Cas4 (RecB family)